MVPRNSTKTGIFRRGMGRERGVRRAIGNSADGSSETSAVGCSSTSSNNAVVRAEPGIHPLETNRVARKLK